MSIQGEVTLVDNCVYPCHPMLLSPAVSTIVINRSSPPFALCPIDGNPALFIAGVSTRCDCICVSLAITSSTPSCYYHLPLSLSPPSPMTIPTNYDITSYHHCTVPPQDSHLSPPPPHLMILSHHRLHRPIS